MKEEPKVLRQEHKKTPQEISVLGMGYDQSKKTGLLHEYLSTMNKFHPKRLWDIENPGREGDNPWIHHKNYSDDDLEKAKESDQSISQEMRDLGERMRNLGEREVSR